MARTRYIGYAKDSNDLVFTYRRNNPTTGNYFTNSSYTCTVEVRDSDNLASTLLSATAMTFDANADGYKYIWAYGSALNGVRSITVRFVPTIIDPTIPSLIPRVTEDYDVSDAIATKIGTTTDTGGSATTGTVDAKLNAIYDQTIDSRPGASVTP